MKPILATLLAVLIFIGALMPASAATVDTSVGKEETSKVAQVSTTIAAITGIAISPLLGTGVYGAYRFISTKEEQRAALPWFATPFFFVPALVVAGLCATKDAFGAVFPPGWKKPLDIMETLENKLSGLIAAGAVIPITMSSLSSILVGSASGVPAAEWPIGLGVVPVAAIDFSWLLNIITVPVGILIFAVVWMASHAINVLILLSPWGAIDAALKAARVSVLGLLTVTTQMDPKNGAVFALIIIAVAYFVSGWAFRLTTFGSLFCWDFFTRRRLRYRPDVTANRVFTGIALAEKVPIRTYGKLLPPADGKYLFRYRPWLVLPERTLEVPEQELMVQRGLIFVDVAARDKILFILPPRYCGHEEELVRHYRFQGVEDAGLLKAWGWIAEAFGVKRKAALAA